MSLPMKKVCSNCIWCTYIYCGGWPYRNGEHMCHKTDSKVTQNDIACDEFEMARYKAIREGEQFPRRKKGENMIDYMQRRKEK